MCSLSLHLSHIPLSHATYRVNIEYVDRKGTVIPVKAKVGDNAMYLAHRYDIELEGNLLHC